MERIAVQVTAELKAALRAQAERAGVPLTEWVRTRLELEGTDPDDVHALRGELARLHDHVKRTAAAIDARQAEWDASERERPAREAEAKRQGIEIAKRLIACDQVRVFAAEVARRGKS